MKIKAREITRATCFKLIDEINSATQITGRKKRRDGIRMALHLATLDKIIRQDNSRRNRDRGKTFDPIRARPAVGPSSRILRPVSPRREQRCREIRCWWPDLFGWLIINNIYATSISSFFRLFFILSFFFFLIKKRNKSCRVYFFVETGSFDAFHQSIHVVNHFQDPALIVAFL